MTHSAVPPPPAFLDESKSLACVHCGLCLGACPTYLETGNENDSPRGRIYIMRALQSGKLGLTEGNLKHIDLCLGCRACESACPSGVQYGALLESTREHIESNYRRSLVQSFFRRVAIEKVIPFPWRMKLALLPGQALKQLGVRRWLPKPVRDALDLLPDHPAAAPLPEFSPTSTNASPRPRLGFVRGCAMSVMFGQTNLASVRLLNRMGCDVIAPREQVCCGALFAHSGNLEQARAFARRNIEVFEKHQTETIVINAAGCGSTLKEYGHLLEADPDWAERARNFSAKVQDLTEFLAAKGWDNSSTGQIASGETEEISSDSWRSLRVTYHDACHLAHAQRITKQPRDLVRAVAGSNYIELPEAEVCCGSAGSYNLTEPEMAERLQQRKIRHILSTGAQVVVTSNPGCILQIQAGLKKAGADQVQVVHIADFLS
jgi:glycolate oxidase iron-sulfur subunit